MHHYNMVRYLLDDVSEEMQLDNGAETVRWLEGPPPPPSGRGGVENKHSTDGKSPSPPRVVREYEHAP